MLDASRHWPSACPTARKTHDRLLRPRPGDRSGRPGDAPLPFIPPAPPAPAPMPPPSRRVRRRRPAAAARGRPGFAVPAAPVSSLGSGTTGVPRPAAGAAGCGSSSSRSSRSSPSPAAWRWARAASSARPRSSPSRRPPRRTGDRGPRADPGGVGHDPRELRRRQEPRRPGARLRRDPGHDRGRRRRGPHEFLTADEARAADQSLSGTFVGIGVQINTEQEDGGPPIVSSIIPNTPAEESDLKRGDRIISVDGWKTEGHTVEEVVSRVRGPEGEPVTLTIGRDGRADFDVTITRRQFDLPLVTLVDGPRPRDVAMIRLEQFATGAPRRRSRARSTTPRRPARRRSSSTCGATPAGT